MSDEPYWSMEKCVANYKSKLIIIIAELFRRARIVPGEVPNVSSGEIWDICLPRYAWRLVMDILQPAESALRRLIIMAAHGRTYVPETLELAPARTDGAAAAGEDNFGDSLLNSPHTAAGSDEPPEGELGKLSPNLSAPAFDMFDPLKKFGYCGFYDDDEWEALQAQKAAERAANPLIIPEADPLKRMDPVNALSLWKRIQALHHAMESFDSYVTRYIRWKGLSRFQLKHKLKITGRKRLGLMRGGSIPGYVRKGKHEVHDVLRDVHILAWDSVSPPKYRWDAG
jgi:hypothetical protein